MSSFVVEDVVAQGVAVVLGGAGFIGSHVARRLQHDARFAEVRVVDRFPSRYDTAPPQQQQQQQQPEQQDDGAEVTITSDTPTTATVTERLVDLRDPALCLQVLHGATVVFLFAADMGGMGFIDGNDARIMLANTRISANVIDACLQTPSVQLLVIASSACVYPISLQQQQQQPTSDQQQHGAATVARPLAEHEAWPAQPLDGYGLEKIYAEKMAEYASKAVPANTQLSVRAARFHNVYGPKGTWFGGREKAPAALLRKACAIKHLLKLQAQQPPPHDPPLKLDLWGNGEQCRSFLYIDDAVDGVLALVHDGLENRDAGLFAAYNIGSERAVSMKDFAHMCCHVADIPDTFVSVNADGPVGVSSRTSDNTLVTARLSWQPRVELEDGLRRTCDWINSEIERTIMILATGKHDFLKDCLKSHRAKADEPLRLAVLLPVTSRGRGEQVLENLKIFFASLSRTVLPEEASIWHFTVMFAVDNDDDVLVGRDLVAMTHQEWLPHLSAIGAVSACVRRFNYPRGSVCAMWRDLVFEAYAGGCDYFVLMGDDVELHTNGWASSIHTSFETIAAERSLPHGFACVAFHDRSFPAFPTFPVIHRCHLQVFSGVAFPGIFVNQDADPFLFQLYARFGCARMLPAAQLENKIGGAGDARYRKQPVRWKGAVLQQAIDHAMLWLRHQGISEQTAKPWLALDVIVPAFRTTRSMLDGILALPVPPNTAVMFIIQMDNPTSEDAQALFRELTDAHRANPFVRIRMNASNIGAGPTRSQAMTESAADWILFLDDDVVPSANVLAAYTEAIRAHPRATGFIGSTNLPPPTTSTQLAVHLAHISYFWNIAAGLPHETELPWGITANLCVRREPDGSVAFRSVFPKTGGGEDIDFCLQLRAWNARTDAHSEGFVSVPSAVVHHPYWNHGECHYSHFSGWSRGDGHLIDLYPDLSYVNLPDLAETLLLAGGAATACLALAQFRLLLHAERAKALAFASAALCTRVAVACVAADVLVEFAQQTWAPAAIGRSTPFKTWLIAVPEAIVIRTWSQAGRILGHLERGRLHRNLFWRFNWFGKMWPDAVTVERKNTASLWIVRALLIVLLVRSRFQK